MLRRGHAIGILLVVLGLANTAPMAAADKEHRQMMADIRMLQEQNQQLQQQLTTLVDVLRSVSAKLDDQTGANRKAFADHRLLVDSLGTDLRVVREKVDETNVRLTSLSQEMEALRVAAASAQSAQAGVNTDTSGAGGATAPPQTLAPPNPGVSPKLLFENARNDYYSARWDLAIQGFESYIKTFPKSDVSDDAQFYIGETHYSAGRFKEAVGAYDRLIANYPASNVLPDAYYKRGLALNTLGQVQQARESFEFAVKNFPDSDAGRLARQWLDRLNRIGK